MSQHSKTDHLLKFHILTCLKQAGFEDSDDRQAMAVWILDQLPTPAPAQDHPFFDFVKTLRDIGTRENLFGQALINKVFENPELLFTQAGLSRAQDDDIQAHITASISPADDFTVTAFGQQITAQEIFSAAHAYERSHGKNPLIDNKTYLVIRPDLHVAMTTLNKAILVKKKRDVNFPFNSLHAFLYGDYRLEKKLSLDDILDSARATLQAIGRRPKQADKTIEYGILTGRTTWRAVNMAFYEAGNGLEGCGYTSLADFLDRNQIYNPSRLTIEEILDSARATLQETGRRPIITDKTIEYGILTGRTTWTAVDKAFYRGGNGLEGCGYTSLADFLDRNQIYNPSRLTIEEILDSARATLQETGRRPIITDKTIEYGALKGRTTWHAVDKAFYRGGNGLEGCGYASLSDFLDAHYVPFVPISLRRAWNKTPCTLARDIVESALTDLKDLRDKISDPAFSIAGKTVEAWDEAFRQGRVLGVPFFTASDPARPLLEDIPVLLEEFFEKSGMITDTGVMTPDEVRQKFPGLVIGQNTPNGFDHP
ncbi:MAG: hypothetical protein J0L77_00945 [Alphaproteobacteria bacterium]|nr:hypothetical protein [Alphaproteobacteria bacterium]